MSRVYSRSDDPSKKETARAKTYPKANMVDNRLNTVMANEPKPFTDEELAKINAMIDSDETTDAEYDNMYTAMTTQDKIATFKQYLADKVSLKDDTMQDGAADKANADVDKLTSSVKSFSGKTVQNGQQRRRKQTRFYKPAETKMTDDPDNIDSDEESGKISLTQEELDAKIAAAVAKATGKPAQGPTIALPPAPIVLLSPKEEEEIQNILSERCVTVGCILRKKLGFDICSPCHRRIREAPIRKLVKENNARNRAIERKEKDRLEKIALERLAAQTEARLKQPI